MACAACPRVRASPRESTRVRASPRFSAPPTVRAGPRPVRVFRHSAYPAGALQSAPRGISGGLVYKTKIDRPNLASIRSDPIGPRSFLIEPNDKKSSSFLRYFLAPSAAAAGRPTPARPCGCLRRSHGTRRSLCRCLVFLARDFARHERR